MIFAHKKVLHHFNIIFLDIIFETRKIHILTHNLSSSIYSNKYDNKVDRVFLYVNKITQIYHTYILLYRIRFFYVYEDLINFLPLIHYAVLASWFRLKYPHIALGALASSAPILYFNGVAPQAGYYYVVTKDFKVTLANMLIFSLKIIKIVLIIKLNSAFI